MNIPGENDETGMMEHDAKCCDASKPIYVHCGISYCTWIKRDGF